MKLKMNNTSNNLDENSKAAKINNTMRIVWIILITVFAAVILWRVYDWSNGQGNLRDILSPLGMIFIGLGIIVRPHNRLLSYSMTGIAAILVVAGLVLAFTY